MNRSPCCRERIDDRWVCADRTEACHATCEAYKAWKAESEAQRDKRNAKAAAANAINGVVIKRIDRWRKRHNER